MKLNEITINFFYFWCSFNPNTCLKWFKGKKFINFWCVLLYLLCDNFTCILVVTTDARSIYQASPAPVGGYHPVLSIYSSVNTPAYGRGFHLVCFTTLSVFTTGSAGPCRGAPSLLFISCSLRSLRSPRSQEMFEVLMWFFLKMNILEWFFDIFIY